MSTCTERVFPEPVAHRPCQRKVIITKHMYCADLGSDVQAQQIVTLESARERQDKAPAAAPHIHDEGPGCVRVDGTPVRRCKRHLQLLLEWVDMLAAAHSLCLVNTPEEVRSI